MLNDTKIEIMKNPLKMEILLLKKSFYQFVKAAWEQVETDEYIDNWHIEMICDYFQAIYEGKIRNLIINQPPRTLKTLISGVFWPAWVWARNPKKKFIFGSYAQTLAVDASIKCRTLIDSYWYQERFPEVQLSKKLENHLQTTRGGERHAIGVDGSTTGRGCDYFIGDDILKADDQFSDTKRENANRWWEQTVSTRLNDIRRGSKIIICQRLHENDIVGHVLEKGEKYEHLVLPMEYDGIRFHSSIGCVDPRSEIGESLHPERFPPEEIENLKTSLGAYAVPGQLQQRPVALLGSIFKKDWFNKRINNLDIRYRFLSFDTAGAVNKNSAFSSCTVGELTKDYHLFIREVWRDRVEFPQLLDAIKVLANKYQYALEAIFIENKSSGPQAIQSLAQSSDDWITDLIVPVNIPSGDDKISRAYSAALWCEAGCVILPPPDENNEWLVDFEDELFKFPSSKYKDQVDAFTQLVNQLTDALAEGLRFRKHKGGNNGII